MASTPGSLAEISLTLGEFARCVGRNVVTVRKWFENDNEVARVPRGGQRPQILIPIPHALACAKKIGIPEDILLRAIERHSQQFGVQPPIKVPAFPPVTRVMRKREPAKPTKPKKRVSR